LHYIIKLVDIIERLDQGYLNPSGQTVNMASPGIEPGSPALQAGTLSKELFRQLLLLLLRTSSTTLALVAGSAGV
jgi:hypothetical protein